MKQRNKHSSLKANLGYSSLYQILIIILPLITAPYVHRVLGVENIGKYSFAYSMAHIFQSIGYLGIKNYGTRTIAACKSEEEKKITFSAIFLMQFIFGLLITLIYVGYCFTLSGIERSLAFVHSLYVAFSFVDISWFFFGIECFKLTVIRNTIVRLITFVLVFILVKKESDLLLYTIILVVGTLIGQITLWMYVPLYTSFCRVPVHEVINHIKPNLILFIPVIAVNVYKYMDKVMIGYYSNDYQTGLYETAEKIVRIPSSIITALGTVMLPRMSSIHDSEYSKKIIRLSMKLATFVCCAMGFGIVAIADTFTPVYFGSQYVEAAPLMAVLASSVLAVSWANVIRTQFLLPNKYDKFYTLSVIIGCLINVVGNYLLIFKLQAMGAVIATVITEYAVFFIQVYFSRKELEFKKYLLDCAHFVLNGLVMVVIGKALGRVLGATISGVIIQVLICGVYYVLSSFLILFFVKKDIAFIKRIGKMEHILR